MENSNPSKVAIIGLGNIGQVVAKNLVNHHRAIIIADRTFAKAQQLATELGTLTTPLSIEQAIKEADIIVLAVWFSAIKELFQQYESLFQGKIVIDPSNPIAPNEKGGFDKIIGETESAGLINTAILPNGAKLAKALGTLGAASLANSANQQPDAAVLFYATDDTNINSSIEQLILDNGFAPVRIGGLDQSIRIEVFGDLHEFGALGKTVTIAEAKSKM
ncbi:NAD(P)-binding domain-containing protein [Flectobacillus sp. DC10W]|jgi:predicted dinucleotide-binding enzyme|uniref:NAD(P)-binding domain-containing protein n=1 Tax=Flectobacillus longus TaxID=2984207 RepID=A0ABT6YLG5_9BACT|nr:NAD(P)-binding domain-containing protein [Flectobacillus longus]MDI9864271.1 NAD(P)-binding domain-containing protein [Flectobacillus longus]